MCVCNNSLKPYRGEISGRRYGAGHYRSSTCITSFLPLVSLNGCRGAQQEGCCLNSISVYPRVWFLFFSLSFSLLCWPSVWADRICICALLLFFPLSLLAAAVVFLRFSLQGLLARTRARVRAANASARAGDRGYGACVCVCAHACRMTFSETWQREEETSDS